jgi:hypothetical protein
MIKAQIVGIKPLNFKPDNGDAVEGVHVHIGYPLKGEGAQGIETRKYFIRKGSDIKLPPNLGLGDCVVHFDQNSKVLAIEAIAQSTLPKA